MPTAAAHRNSFIGYRWGVYTVSNNWLKVSELRHVVMNIIVYKAHFLGARKYYELAGRLAEGYLNNQAVREVLAGNNGKRNALPCKARRDHHGA